MLRFGKSRFGVGLGVFAYLAVGLILSRLTVQHCIETWDNRRMGVLVGCRGHNLFITVVTGGGQLLDGGVMMGERKHSADRHSCLLSGPWALEIRQC